MRDGSRSWYCLTAGAWGGLNGWLIASMFALGSGAVVSGGQHVMYGLIIGGAIGLLTAGVDSIATLSWRRFLRVGGLGALAGGAGGMLALPLAEKIYEGGQFTAGFTLGNLLRGLIGWALLGAVIGCAETLPKGTQHWKGALGGVIGGGIGGVAHEILRINADGASGQLILAVSLALLGGSISLSISTITAMLSGAWLEVTNGKQAGRRFDLTKFVIPRQGVEMKGLIGSDEWRTHVYLTGDSGILPQHAAISLIDGFPVLCSAAKGARISVNGELVDRSRLRDGDTLTFGATSLIYREKNRSRRS